MQTDTEMIRGSNMLLTKCVITKAYFTEMKPVRLEMTIEFPLTVDALLISVRLQKNKARDDAEGGGRTASFSAVFCEFEDVYLESLLRVSTNVNNAHSTFRSETVSFRGYRQDHPLFCLERRVAVHTVGMPEGAQLDGYRRHVLEVVEVVALQNEVTALAGAVAADAADSLSERRGLRTDLRLGPPC